MSKLAKRGFMNTKFTVDLELEIRTDSFQDTETFEKKVAELNHALTELGYPAVPETWMMQDNSLAEEFRSGRSWMCRANDITSPEYRKASAEFSRKTGSMSISMFRRPREDEIIGHTYDFLYNKKDYLTYDCSYVPVQNRKYDKMYAKYMKNERIPFFGDRKNDALLQKEGFSTVWDLKDAMKKEEFDIPKEAYADQKKIESVFRSIFGDRTTIVKIQTDTAVKQLSAVCIKAVEEGHTMDEIFTGKDI